MTLAAACGNLTKDPKHSPVISEVVMIKYDRLWETMREKDISQYDLYTKHNVPRSQLHRLRHNLNIEVNTIDRLCHILHCRVEDIMEHFDDDNVF